MSPVLGRGRNSVLSDWPVRCAAERIIGNDSYLSEKHYLLGASIFQSSASLRSAGTTRSTGSGLLTDRKAIGERGAGRGSP